MDCPAHIHFSMCVITATICMLQIIPGVREECLLDGFCRGLSSVAHSDGGGANTKYREDVINAVVVPRKLGLVDDGDEES